MSDLQNLKRQFLEYLEIEKGRSLKTVENYDRYLNRFIKQMGITAVSDITDDSLRDFRLWLNRQTAGRKQFASNLKKNTQNYHLIAIRTFLKYLARRGVKSLSPDRIELAKVPGRDLDLVTSVELKRLLDGPKGSDEKSLRDKAILELFFSTGLRVSELCSLDRDSVDLTRDEFSIRGKGEKVRLVFLSDEAREAIKDYLAKRADMEESLFVNISNNNKGGTAVRITPRV